MSEYTLALSEAEIGRYQMMAQQAVAREASQLAAAGVVAGATVADIGCGPAAMSIELARLVGSSGQVIAVERDKQALAAAAIIIQRSETRNVSLHEATAIATGLEPGTVDVVMLRHVLAHNGGHEQAIVGHLATLIRPGGSVYLVDTDLSGYRLLDIDPDLDDVTTRYVEFHRRRGNDPGIGLRLAQLLVAAGLEVISFHGAYNILPARRGCAPRPGLPATPCSPTASWTRACCTAGRQPWPGSILRRSGPLSLRRSSPPPAAGRSER